MKNITLFVRRFALPIFFLLAYALSWFPSIFEAHSLLPIGPLFAALIVLAFFGLSDVKDFLRAIVQWRVGIGWYALVVLLPIATTGGAAGLNLLFGAHVQSAVQTPALPDLVGTLIFILLFIGLGEEAAWRGFALPRLMVGRSALAASLMLAILHIIWHFPLFGSEFDSTNGLQWGLGIIAFTIITTWMYNRTQGSLILPILFHTSANMTAKYLFNPLFTGADLIQLWWLWSGFWWIVALAILVINGSNLAKPAATG